MICHNGDVPGDLRERKKARTRAAISAAALRLFAQRGYEAVTIADVAAAAEVGQRTVFRYFGDKDELLFGEDTAFRAALADALAARPQAEPAAVALREASATIAGALDARREELLTRTAVIDASPALAARERAKHAGFEAVIMEGLGARGLSEPAARLLARLGVACYAEALARWLDDPAFPLPDVMRACFAELGAALNRQTR